jgi:alkanesulfonate monooxygenase SsuD/methylene tetrahydromethanopterin reductase-like flavin-dependent oxidoreductase (luciferase family)
LDHILSCTAIGGPDTVAAQMQAFLDKTQPDELIVTCNMYDHAARLRSFDIVAQVHGQAQAGER